MSIYVLRFLSSSKPNGLSSSLLYSSISSSDTSWKNMLSFDSSGSSDTQYLTLFYNRKHIDLFNLSFRFLKYSAFTCLSVSIFFWSSIREWRSLKPPKLWRSSAFYIPLKLRFRALIASGTCFWRRLPLKSSNFFLSWPICSIWFWSSDFIIYSLRLFYRRKFRLPFLGAS